MLFQDYLKDNIVVFDGAFGTMLQKKTTDIGTRPERLNLEKPEIVASIYRAYANAGADVISAATFGANAKKIGSYELSEKLIRAGVELAKKTCPDKFIALDLGPTGALLEPSGDTTFEEIYKVYAHAVNAGKHFADVILFETMADLHELKAAVLAARENSDLPIIASMTFEQNMRTFMGVSVESFVISISPLVDAIGVNCSLGPNQLLPVVEKILSLTDKPIIVQANAGLPDSSNNYAVTPENFAEYAKKFVNLGARIIGGCCGTTPDYIKLLRNIADEKGVLLRKVQPYSAVSTARKAVFIEGVCAVGENINPTNKAEMQNALINEDFDYFTDLAFDMADGGAQILDVNCACAGVDETKILPKLIKHLQAISPLPLMIDSTNHEAIENALRVYCGKAIINSTSAKAEDMQKIFLLAKKYGAAVVAMTIDENGLPKTKENRIEIAKKIIDTAKEYEIPESDIFIDCVAYSTAVYPDELQETLSAITEIKEKFGVKTVLGISNFSFGLPDRQNKNAEFLKLAIDAGLDLPIVDVCQSEIAKILEDI